MGRSRLLPLAVAAALLIVGCDTGTTPTSRESATTTSDPPFSSVPSSSTPDPASRPDPVEGWSRLDVDTGVFGDVIPVDGVVDGERVVLVGCPSDGIDDFPIWWSDDAFAFSRASGPGTQPPPDVNCFRQVVSTSFGWFAGGSGPLVRSTDGKHWDVVDVPGFLGYEEPFQLGYADDLFVSPEGDRLTVLYRRAAEAESTVATLVTTTDGETWVENAHPSQSLFDSSRITAVIEGGDGLLAAGSSPGGEFVPSAAVFTSPDGLRWRRVTPRGSPDFDDKMIEGIAEIGDRFIAVGGDVFETGLMTAWSSTDGFAWRRLPSPPETTDPSVAHMTGQAVTVADGSIWVSGLDFDARRGGPQAVPALWRSTDGEAWLRVPFDDLEVDVPFEILATTDLDMGVWPPPSSLLDEEIVLYVRS